MFWMRCHRDWPLAIAAWVLASCCVGFAGWGFAPGWPGSPVVTIGAPIPLPPPPAAGDGGSVPGAPGAAAGVGPPPTGAAPPAVAGAAPGAPGVGLFF